MTLLTSQSIHYYFFYSKIFSNLEATNQTPYTCTPVDEFGEYMDDWLRWIVETNLASLSFLPLNFTGIVSARILGKGS